MMRAVPRLARIPRRPITRWEPSTSARRCRAAKTRASSAAKAASSTTSSCRACSTRPSSAARTPTRASPRSARTRRGALPGVAHVFTFADLARCMKPLPLFGAIPPGLAARVDVTMKQAPQLALCRDAARYVGEIVAMVLAESRALAEDAASWSRSTTSRSPRGHRRGGGGWRPGAPRPPPGVGRTTSASTSDAASATSAARPRRRRRAGARALRRPALRRACRSRRAASSRSGIARDGTPHHLERHAGRPLRPAGPRGRARAARPQDPRRRPRRGRRLRHQGQRLSGGPADPRGGHRDAAAGEVDRGPARAHDGARPTRAHQVHDIEIGARRDGTMLAVRDHIWVDFGAYNSWGIVLPVQHGGAPARPAPRAEPRRGVPRRGDQQDAERALPRRGPARGRLRDGPHRGLPGPRASRWTRRSSRRKNYLSAADLPYELDLPYRDGNPLVYDSGDFRAGLEAALGAVDYEALRAGAGRASRAGRLPRHRHLGLRRGHGHRARTRARRCGWTPPAARWWRPARRARGRGRRPRSPRWRPTCSGIPIEWVTVVGGDTAAIPFGIGHVREPERGERGQLDPRRRGPRAGQARGRRGGAPRGGARRRRDRRRHGLGARGARLRDAARPRDPGRAPHVRARRRGRRADFEATVYHHQPTVTYTSAVHVACVEVDAGTGAVRLLRYLVAHDCGRLINPDDRGGPDPRRRRAGRRRRRSSRRWSTTSRGSS